MGYYVETNSTTSKAQELISKHNAVAILPPLKFEVPEGKVLVCVVKNGPFDAAGICFDEREFRDFAYPDGRIKSWLLMDKTTVIVLCPGVEGVI